MSLAPHCLPLADRLPRIAGNAVRLSRLAFDARFEPWLRALLQLPDLTVTPIQGFDDSDLALQLQTPQGCAEFGFQGKDWPAMAMALALPPPHDGCEVAELLLGPLLERLAARLGGGRLRRIATSTPAPDALVLRTPWGRVALRSIDRGLAQQLAAELSAQRVPGRLLPALGLRGRIRIAERHWPWSALRSLQPGDVVLLEPRAGDGRPDATWPATVFFGVGTPMQASTELDPQASSVTLNAPPIPSRGNAGAPDAAPLDALDDLQLPVSFEIDTARISLGELASMKAGTVIELDAPLLQSSVRLVCHGQTVAHGQLVATGEQLGVRITRMGLGPQP